MNKLVKLKRKIDQQRILNWFADRTHVSIDSVVKVNDDFTVDFAGNLWWQRLDLEELPVKFRNFKGAMFVGRNKLKSTEGFPLNADRIECHENSVQLYRPEGYTGLFFNTIRPKFNLSSKGIILAELTLSGDLLDDVEQKQIHGIKKNPTTQFY